LAGVDLAASDDVLKAKLLEVKAEMLPD